MNNSAGRRVLLTKVQLLLTKVKTVQVPLPCNFKSLQALYLAEMFFALVQSLTVLYWKQSYPIRTGQRIKSNIFSLKKNTEAKSNKLQLHTSMWVSQVAQW